MKQIQFVNAYKTINKLSDMNLKLNTAYKIYKLREIVKNQYDFQTEQEQKAVIDSNAIINDDGSVRFENTEDRNKFLKFFNEINDMEVDIKIEPIQIRLSENIELSINDMENLKGFVEFIDE